jgi:hypothetical protein
MRKLGRLGIQLRLHTRTEALEHAAKKSHTFETLSRIHAEACTLADKELSNLRQGLA